MYSEQQIIWSCVLPADLDILVFGIQDDPDLVISGDIYVCTESVTIDGPIDGHYPELVVQALHAGAVAIIAEEDSLLEGVPESVPVLYVPDTQEFSQRLAAIFYGRQPLLGGKELKKA